MRLGCLFCFSFAFFLGVFFSFAHLNIALVNVSLCEPKLSGSANTNMMKKKRRRVKEYPNERRYVHPPLLLLPKEDLQLTGVEHSFTRDPIHRLLGLFPMLDLTLECCLCGMQKVIFA
jgi:hypothetical protein